MYVIGVVLVISLFSLYVAMRKTKVSPEYTCMKEKISRIKIRIRESQTKN